MIAHVEKHAVVEKLLGKHARQIRTIIDRRCGAAVLRVTTVEDVYQDAVAAVLKDADSFEYRGEARFIAWATTISQRIICQHLRRRPSTVISLPMREGNPAAGSDPISPDPGPLSRAERNEEQKRVRYALADLPADYRRVIELYKIQERSLGEVAETMTRTKGATCRLLARAMARLRQRLDQ